jgi:methyl-accepting chemotaxis protein
MVLALSAALLMALTYVWVIPTIEKQIFSEKQEKTKNLVDVAVSIVSHYAEQAKSGRMNEKEAKKAAAGDVRALRYMGDNYFWITDLDSVVVMHPIKSDLAGQNMENTTDAKGKRLYWEMSQLGKAKGQGFVDYYWPKPGEKEPQPKLSYVKLVPEWGWLIGTGIYVDDVRKQVNNLTYTLLAVVIGIFVLTIFASALMTKSITAPLQRALELVKDIAQGEGDLTARLEVSSKDEVGRLCEEFNRFVQKLHDLITSAKESTSIVGRSTDEISQGNQNLSERIQQQASSIEETASAMEEMSSAVNQEAEHANQANALAQKTAGMAEQGGKVVESTINAMAEVNTSSHKISEIITVVNEIAFQTNLLALNAAVEAARAGEAGRGFAVVAGEVRNLAGRSATAAKEIQELITDSVGKVEQGNDLVKQSGDLLKEIITNVKSVAETTGEITASIKEQAQGIGEVNKAVALMDEAVQNNAAMVEEVASASEEMAAAALELTSQMGRFKVQEFAGQVGQPRKKLNNPVARPQATKTGGSAAKAKPATKNNPQTSDKPKSAKKAASQKENDDLFGELDLDGFEEF